MKNPHPKLCFSWILEREAVTSCVCPDHVPGEGPEAQTLPRGEGALTIGRHGQGAPRRRMWRGCHLSGLGSGPGRSGLGAQCRRPLAPRPPQVHAPLAGRLASLPGLGGSGEREEEGRAEPRRRARGEPFRASARGRVAPPDPVWSGRTSERVSRLRPAAGRGLPRPDPPAAPTEPDLHLRPRLRPRAGRGVCA